MDAKNGRRIILASASPRRKELLAFLIPKFDIVPSTVIESSNGTPSFQVVTLAANKAAQIAALYPNALVIGADTLVFLGSKPLGKPENETDARRMLRLLSGRTHRVLTGVCVICGNKRRAKAALTRVRFAELTDDEISAYIDTGEPMDKAGAYGIQGQFSKHIKEIHGCYHNVMGLPLNLLYNMLKSL
ncbi:MAG: Maf family protein [Christensenellales bacterium]